jgi:hypothetical protein
MAASPKSLEFAKGFCPVAASAVGTSVGVRAWSRYTSVLGETLVGEMRATNSGAMPGM